MFMSFIKITDEKIYYAFVSGSSKNWTWGLILQIPRMKNEAIQCTEDAAVTSAIGDLDNVIEHFSDEGH